MSLVSSAFAQHLVACIVFAYVAFCFLYGYSSLRARRFVPADGPLGIGNPPDLPRRSPMVRIGFVTRVSCSLLIPVFAVSSILSLSGRERSGVIEPHNLFVVPHRPWTTTSFIAPIGPIAKGQPLVTLNSETLGHRLEALRAKRLELGSDGASMELGVAKAAPELIHAVQSREQQGKTLEARISELGRTLFSTNQQSISGKVAWQRANQELEARITSLQQALTLHQEELLLASARFDRIAQLRNDQFATVTQFEQAKHAKSIAENRVETTRDALTDQRQAKLKLATGQEQIEKALNDQRTELSAELEKAKLQLSKIEEELVVARARLVGDEKNAISRRGHLIEAAAARIAELDSEIAIVMAEMRVKSPINGKVIYSNQATALNGTLPLAVVATDHGFVLRVDIMLDEVAALKEQADAGKAFQVLIDDERNKRLVPAKIISFSDENLDGKRVAVTFGLDLPEDMLVRMALKGTTPRATLKWNPPATAVLSTRFLNMIGIEQHSDQRMAVGARQKGAPVPVKNNRPHSEPQYLNL